MDNSPVSERDQGEGRDKQMSSLKEKAFTIARNSGPQCTLGSGEFIIAVRLEDADAAVEAMRRQADAEMTQVLGSDGFLCGVLHGQSGPFVGGCKKHIRFMDAYRCADCTASFHRDCIREHFRQETATRPAPSGDHAALIAEVRNRLEQDEIVEVDFIRQLCTALETSEAARAENATWRQIHSGLSPEEHQAEIERIATEINAEVKTELDLERELVAVTAERDALQRCLNAEHCWHCGVALESRSRPRCATCPDECDAEGCDAFGCSDRGTP